MLRALSLERHTPQDPKRFYKYTDVYDQVKFFDHDTWVALQTEVVLPENTLAVDAIAFLEGYKDIVSYDMETMDWFAQLKEYGQTHGYAVNNKQFKEGGYKGKVGDLAMLLRLVLCGSKQTPDLYSVMK